MSARSGAGTRLDQLARDVRFGFRQIRRNLRFSTMAIATLALGIGGMAAMFSAFDTVLIRPLPYTAAEQARDDLGRPGSRRHPEALSLICGNGWSGGGRNTVFSDMAATTSEDATLSGDAEPEQVRARKATSISGACWA